MAPAATITIRTVVKASAAALIAVALLPDEWAHALRPFQAGGHDLSFWISQALLLAVLGLLTWGMNTFWDRFVEVTASRLIGGAVNMTVRIATPAARLAWRGLLLAWSRRPPNLRDPEGQWRALLLAAWAITAAALLSQHLQNAHEVVSSKGLHRRELPPLAAGVLHWRWRGVCLRAQDGALPQLPGHHAPAPSPHANCSPLPQPRQLARAPSPRRRPRLRRRAAAAACRVTAPPGHTLAAGWRRGGRVEPARGAAAGELGGGRRLYPASLVRR